MCVCVCACVRACRYEHAQVSFSRKLPEKCLSFLDQNSTVKQVELSFSGSVTRVICCGTLTPTSHPQIRASRKHISVCDVGEPSGTSLQSCLGGHAEFLDGMFRVPSLAEKRRFQITSPGLQLDKPVFPGISLPGHPAAGRGLGPEGVWSHSDRSHPSGCSVQPQEFWIEETAIITKHLETSVITSGKLEGKTVSALTTPPHPSIIIVFLFRGSVKSTNISPLQSDMSLGVSAWKICVGLRDRAGGNASG